MHSFIALLLLTCFRISRAFEDMRFACLWGRPAYVIRVRFIGRARGVIRADANALYLDERGGWRESVQARLFSNYMSAHEVLQGLREKLRGPYGEIVHVDIIPMRLPADQRPLELVRPALRFR